VAGTQLEHYISSSSMPERVCGCANPAAAWYKLWPKVYKHNHVIFHQFEHTVDAFPQGIQNVQGVVKAELELSPSHMYTIRKNHRLI
jgi:hypothetical protein